jgi:hypothetical protein
MNNNDALLSKYEWDCDRLEMRIDRVTSEEA